MTLQYDQFIESLSNLHDITAREDAEMLQVVKKTVVELRKVGTITRKSLAVFIQDNPQAVPIIATSAGLGQEQLKNQLRRLMGTTGWVTLARNNSTQLIEVLDQEFDLVNHLTKDINKTWALEDVLLERHLWSHRPGAQSVGQGRKVENEVEEIAKKLDLPYTMRTQFEGRSGETAPCDLAIPNGSDALIVVAMKGFNSTGSKLSDAVKEIEKMARVKYAKQFVFVVIDGIGWLSRQADLKRIFELWQKREIDGLYSLKYLDQFSIDLRDAAVRLSLLSVE
ncbi:hypothetical protein JT05_11710 [Desulfosporosinus sp. Tol-M]|nr:hypothetical protein JT05_11710 [Desulfosporosinus sp. Tol-M]